MRILAMNIDQAILLRMSSVQKSASEYYRVSRDIGETNRINDGWYRTKMIYCQDMGYYQHQYFLALFDFYNKNISVNEFKKKEHNLNSNKEKTTQKFIKISKSLDVYTL